VRSPTEMRKLLKGKIVQQGGICAICHEGFTDYNDVVPTTGIRKEWEERGGMTTRTISRQHIGGVMMKKGQADWTNDGRLTGRSARLRSRFLLNSF
jgi:hypothetical protein